LIIALDVERLGPASILARRLCGYADTFKIGSRLFTAEGPRVVERLSRLAPRIFLDLKFHDIPNSVDGAVAAAASLPGVCMMTIHALGGMNMMQAARRALQGKRSRPKLLGVTLLTSLDAKALHRVGIAGRPAARAVQLARLAQEAGLDGVVTSAQEAAAIRHACGRRFLIVVPGVRPAPLGGVRPVLKDAAMPPDDQARVATPAGALRAGADYLVVGRAITGAADPVAAAECVLEEMAAALDSR
jgi:orotidine-5'-phosphate decarboxylase